MKNARILLAVLLSGVTAGAQPRSDRWESLLGNPPFGASRGGRVAAGGGPAQFEFRGVMDEAGDYSFCVYDQGRHLSDWVKLNETGGPFVARHFDPARDTLTIEHNGQSLTLALKRVPRLAPPAPVVDSPPPLPVSGDPAPGASQGNTPSATSAGNSPEAQRLQNIADEIRRRRGLRQMPPQENPPRRPP